MRDGLVDIGRSGDVALNGLAAARARHAFKLRVAQAE
jgi:hypothetical protein